MRLVKLFRERNNAKTARDMTGKFIPFRAPHYTCSERAIREEFALAAGGVLYLDQFNEFRRGAIEQIVAKIQSSHIQSLPVAIIADTYVPEEFDELAKERYILSQNAKLQRIEDAIVGRFKP